MDKAVAASSRTGTQRGLLALIVGAHSVQGTRRALWGYLFIAPWIVGLLVFVGGPILISLYLSFTTYDILSPPKWVGVANYQKAFFEDPLFWPSLWRSFYYALVVVPVGLVLSLMLATLLNQGLLGTSVYRTLYFLPSLTPSVALSILWLFLMQPKIGPLNVMLSALGLGTYPFLTDANTVIPSIILIALSTSAGGGQMIIFLAGLQGVPKELEEAAVVDGAGVLTKFRHVTLPMITPTIFFNLILGIIGALQVFTVAWVATQGGPNYGSWFFALHIYQQAFVYLRLGYGATLAWIFVVIVLAITLLNFAFSRNWVYYRGGS